MRSCRLPRRTNSFLLAVLFAACRQPPPVAPGNRLPSTVRPVRQTVDVRVNPALPRFSASVDIDVVLAKPEVTLWLHSVDLSYSLASATREGDERTLQLTPAANQMLGLSAKS